jgi:hypothetical protein
VRSLEAYNSKFRGFPNIFLRKKIIEVVPPVGIMLRVY